MEKIKNFLKKENEKTKSKFKRFIIVALCTTAKLISLGFADMLKHYRRVNSLQKTPRDMLDRILVGRYFNGL